MPYETAHKRDPQELQWIRLFVCHGGPMGDELGAILAKKVIRGYST